MKAEIPEKFAAKINEFMILRDIRLAPGVIVCPCFIEGSWCEAWTVFKDESNAGTIAEGEEHIYEEIYKRLKEKGLEYTVRQVNIVDPFTPLRCRVGDHFYASADPETVEFLEKSSHLVTAKKPPQRPPEQTQI
jgi:hypothetical protein